jgi:hypothetical protein
MTSDNRVQGLEHITTSQNRGKRFTFACLRDFPSLGFLSLNRCRILEHVSELLCTLVPVFHASRNGAVRSTDFSADLVVLYQLLGGGLNVLHEGLGRVRSRLLDGNGLSNRTCIRRLMIRKRTSLTPKRQGIRTIIARIVIVEDEIPLEKGIDFDDNSIIGAGPAGY